MILFNRTQAIAVYRKIMDTFEESSLTCVDLSEQINTYGISPLYELQIKGKASELRKVILSMQTSDITIKETVEGISII